jgi:hypothetical protein
LDLYEGAVLPPCWRGFAIRALYKFFTFIPHYPITKISNISFSAHICCFTLLVLSRHGLKNRASGWQFILLATDYQLIGRMSWLSQSSLMVYSFCQK